MKILISEFSSPFINSVIFNKISLINIDNYGFYFNKLANIEISKSEFVNINVGIHFNKIIDKFNIENIIFKQTPEALKNMTGIYFYKDLESKANISTSKVKTVNNFIKFS